MNTIFLKCGVLSLLISLYGTLAEVHAHIGDKIYYVPGIDPSEMNFTDADVTDWRDYVGEPLITSEDFIIDPTVGDADPYDTSDLGFEIWLGHHDGKLYMAVERYDDFYINRIDVYDNDVQNSWRMDGLEFMVDGDHSGGDYSGSADDSWSNTEKVRNNNRTAQQYMMLAESEVGPLLGYMGSGTWPVLPPYAGISAATRYVDTGVELDFLAASAHGYSRNPPSVVSTYEIHVTPFDDLNHESPNTSVPSEMIVGQILGFQISAPDFDYDESYYSSFRTLSGQARTWRYADRFVDALLLEGNGPSQQITSHPSRDQWYSNRDVTVEWSPRAGDYYVVDLSPLGDLADMATEGRATTDTTLTISAPEDGAYKLRIGVQEGAALNVFYERQVLIDTETDPGSLVEDVPIWARFQYGFHDFFIGGRTAAIDGGGRYYLGYDMYSYEGYFITNPEVSDFSSTRSFNSYYWNYNGGFDEEFTKFPSAWYPVSEFRAVVRGESCVSTGARYALLVEAEFRVADVIPTDSGEFNGKIYQDSTPDYGCANNIDGSWTDTLLYDNLDTYRTYIPRADEPLVVYGFNTTSLSLLIRAGDSLSGVSEFLVSVDENPDGIPEGQPVWTWTDERNTYKSNRVVTVDGLKDGVNYAHLLVRDKAGNEAISHFAIYVDLIPPTPTTPTARTYDNGDVLITWSEVSDERSGVDFYRIYRTTIDGALGSLIADNISGSSYLDLSRSNGGTLLADLEYFYTVRAVDKLGNESTSERNIQVGSKSSLPLPNSESVVLDEGGRIFSGAPFTLEMSGSFDFTEAAIDVGDVTVVGSTITVNATTSWSESVDDPNWSIATQLEGLDEDVYTVRLLVNENTVIARFDLEVVGLPTVVAESTTFETVPNPATISDEVSLTIRGQLPSADASLAQASLVSTSDSEVVIDIQTQWDGDTGNADATDFETQVSIGYLQVGTYEVAIQVNGLEVTRSSLEILEGPPPEGPISLDFDTNEGDQEQRLAKGARPDREYTLDINVADVQAINGWNIVVEYDPSMVEYVGGSFAPGSFISGLLGLEDVSKSNRVGVGGTVLGTNAQGVGSGTLGQMKFRVAEGFSGETTLRIVEISLRPVDGEQIKLEVLHTVTLSDEVDLVGDANGDGVVGFDDFFLFADAFGGADPAFDYDGSGTVDFSDFFIFADNFGKEAQAKLIAMAHELIGLPKESGLLPNYPNPFNMETTIPFQVMQEGEYLVAIYNTTGQLVRTLHSGFIPYGLHTLSWNGLDDQAQPVSSGVYLISLRGKDMNDLRKLMLLK